jgi:hypothetical protein
MSERPFIDADGNVNERAQAAIDEIKHSILKRYPDVTFRVHPGFDDPTSICLEAIVDLEDPDAVLEGLTDRLVDILVDDGVPLHVLPLYTPERALAAYAAYKERQRNPWSGEFLAP